MAELPDASDESLSRLAESLYAGRLTPSPLPAVA